MNARDRSRLSSLGGKSMAMRRKRMAKRGPTITDRITKSNRASNKAGRRNTAMQRVRIAFPRAYCQLGTTGNGINWIVYDPTGVLAEAKSPRAAWEAALAEALAKSVAQ